MHCHLKAKPCFHVLPSYLGGPGQACGCLSRLDPNSPLAEVWSRFLGDSAVSDDQALGLNVVGSWGFIGPI